MELKKRIGGAKMESTVAGFDAATKKEVPLMEHFSCK